MSRRRREIGSTTRRVPGDHSAFALAAVIVCLVLVAVALVGVARRSLTVAAETRRLKHDLQLKWGARSCQKALLKVAPDLFLHLEEASAEADAQEPAPSLRSFSFRLGNTALQVSLRDESAAFDINTAYHYAGRAATEASLRRLLGPNGGSYIRLRTPVQSHGKPDVRELDEPLPTAFQGWGQVFQTDRMRTLAGRRQLLELTASLTCSPNVGLNVRRAPDDVVQATCLLVVSSTQASRIVERCRERPRPHVHRIIEQLGVKKPEQLLLKELLAEQSSCYSVWIDASDGRRHQITSVVVRYQDDGTYGVTSSCY